MGYSRAFIVPDELRETSATIAYATIFSFPMLLIEDDEWFMLGDEYSGDLLDATTQLKELRDLESEKFDDDVSCQQRAIVIERFRVMEPFQKRGHGKKCAHKMLLSAGAAGSMVMMIPGQISEDKTKGASEEQIRRFWQNLVPGEMEEANQALYCTYFPASNPDC